MKVGKKIGSKGKQSGIALLLAIFVLLLVCVAGLAMVAASGTETSLTGNYRSSTGVYYAALSGLEEGRGRLLPKNPNYLGPYLPSPGTPLALGQAIYIRNWILSRSEVDPTNLGSPDTFPDTEWQSEFGTSTPSSWQYVDYVPTISGPGAYNPPYKWVRINALTEQALKIDVNGGGPNATALIYFDGTNLILSPTPYQALGVTALAALPDGSRKLLQYVVAPVTLQLPVTAALTLVGPGTGTLSAVSFSAPATTYSFQVNGNDLCSPAQLPGIGVLNFDDWDFLHNNYLPTHSPGQYTGSGGSIPNVSNPYVHPANANFDMTDPVSLTSLVQTITEDADTVLTGSSTGSDMPPAMSPTNPMTVVVNGDLTLNGFTGGYGLLLVRGKLTYSGDSGWKGIVLVIGQGDVEETGSANTGEFDGAVFVAKLGSGAGLPILAPSSYTVASGGKGIFYDSCWVAKALKPVKYKVISFHEIPYP